MPIPEIIVVGQQPDPIPQIPPPRPSTPFFDTFERDLEGLDAAEAARERAQEQFEQQQRGFLAPVLPQVIEEIIVTAQVRPPPRIPIGGIGGIAAGIALLGSAFAREISEQRLEEAFRVFSDIEPRTPDSPVRTIAQSEAIPEIVVTGRRTFPRLLPFPSGYRFISPDADPFEMQPIIPRTFPQPPAAVPDVAVPTPQTLPEPAIPLEFPLPTPRITPTIQPGIETSPGTQPEPVPIIEPSPFIETLPDPAPEPFPTPTPAPEPFPAPTPLTPFQPTGLPSPGITSFPFAMPMEQPLTTRAQKCKPCPKPKAKKQKRRKQCFKKLVKEGITPSKDTEFRWVRIDCLTGRELRNI